MDCIVDIIYMIGEGHPLNYQNHLKKVETVKHKFRNNGNKRYHAPPGTIGGKLHYRGNV
jgi:hypothetical protein